MYVYEVKNKGSKISMNMITQRSMEEGHAMEKGKTNPDYFDACSIIEMNPEDMKKARDLEKLECQGDQRMRQRYCESNCLRPVVSRRALPHPAGRLGKPGRPATDASTGTPEYSGFPVTMVPAIDERIKAALEFVTGQSDSGKEETNMPKLITQVGCPYCGASCDDLEGLLFLTMGKKSWRPGMLV